MASAYSAPQDMGLAPTAVMTASAPYDQTAYAQQQQTPPSQGTTPQDAQPPLPVSNLALHQQQPSVQPSSQSRSVKRPRPVKSCTECRKRKLKCDRLLPCSQCKKSSRECRYAPDSDPNNLSDASDTEGAETRPVKRMAVSSASATSAAGRPDGHAPAPKGDALTMTVIPLLEDLTARMERIENSTTARRPGHAVDGRRGAAWRDGGGIEVSPDTVRGLSVKHGGSRTRFFGPASPRVLLNLFDEAREFMKDHTRDPGTREVFASFRKLHKLLRTEYQKSLTPITVFVDSMMPIHKRMADILPKKPVCDKLLRGYLDNNETLYRVIHAPSFMAHYNRYWEGSLQSEAFLPKLLGVLSIASRFETKSRGLSHERSEGVHLPTAAALVRLWLNNLRGKHLVEMDTLQVELLWLLTMRMIKEHARDGWAQLGSILRMAMGMGLHRDPSEFGPRRITPFNAEMRRRLWATVADLDYYISNDCNLPSLLREEDSTTGPPSNLDDADLRPEMLELPPSKPFDQITDNHVQAYAAVTFGLRKRAAALVNRIDKIHDWDEILDVAGKLERHLNDIELIFPARPAENVRKARYWRCRGLLDGHVRQPLMNLYRPFVLGVPGVPTTITRAYLRHAASIVQSIEELDPSMPDYECIADLCHVGVKSDAVQAAMSMCYYIRSATRPNLDAASQCVQQALRVSPEMDASAVAGDGVLWSRQRLVQGVEKVIDFLIQNIKRGDTKDIICLSVVLESVRSPEPHRADMERGLRVVLDSCLRAANCSLERLANAQPDAATQVAEASYGAGMMGGAATGYAQPAPSGNLMGSLPEEEGWMFWDGWD